jgi:predicted RNA-binding protein with PUA-like domain
MTQFWLLKSEPSTYGIDDLMRDGDTTWDGVRNYQARIYLRAMQVNDLAFFYHSNTDPMGIAGLCKIVATLVPDPTQFDPQSEYFDPKSVPNAPRWETVRVAFVEKFRRVISLDTLKMAFGDELMVARKGNRFSVTPVMSAVAERILAMVHDQHQ